MDHDRDAVGLAVAGKAGQPGTREVVLDSPVPLLGATVVPQVAAAPHNVAEDLDGGQLRKAPANGHHHPLVVQGQPLFDLPAVDEHPAL
ncbi:MAG: hypothetical protein ACRDRA_11025, partial [Pseudonocardiaceae bacterium]